MMKFVTDIKISAFYLLDLSGGRVHHGETTSPRLFHPVFYSFQGTQ